MAESPKSFQETLRELWALLTSYARQETVGPFKSLGQRIGFGLGGSVAVSLGWFLMVLGVVRFLQTHELPWIFGTWFLVHDWTVYFIGAFLLGVGMWLAFRRAKRPDPALPAPRPATNLPATAGATTSTGS